MNALKSSIFVYDLVTLPLYYIFQRPWRKRRRAKAIRATSSRENDPSSIWRPVGKAKQNITDNCDLVDAYFKRMVKIYGSKRCLGVRDTVHEEEEVQSDGKVFKKKILAPNYRWYTYSQIDKRIDDVTRGLLLSGVKPKEKVIIFAETRLEWMITFLALMRLGAVVSTLYATLGEESIIYGINQLQSSCIVTTSELLPKVKKILDKAPSLKLIINIEDNFSKSKNDYSKQVDNDNVTVVSFAELESKGSEASPDLKGEPHSPDDVALIMYTSGSTGVPKGVLITNKNVMATQKGCYLIGKDWKSSKEDAKYIAFLPLAHIMELTAELFFLSMGLGIGYSSPLTLSDRSPGIKQGSLGDIAVLRPAAMTGVPLVIEKIRKGVLDQVKARGKFFKQFFDFAIIYKSYWFEKGYNTPLLDFLLFRKIKAGFGGNLEVWLSGGAPLSPESQAFLRACLGVKMLLGYGATETCGGACISNLYDRSTGRVGAPLLGVYLKLIPWEEGNYNPTDKPNPRGEIIIGGDCVSLGYYKNDEQTKEDFWQDEHGIRWFKTGDIGELFPDGTLKIIDRRKDLIKLQQGEYVSLGK
ncbi:long chain fatty acid CoA ligase-like protein, partial [Dinothrombium tinctorium]